MGRGTEMVKADPAAVYQAIKSGDLDLHTDAWLPQTHSTYFRKVAQETVSLGPVYGRGCSGWMVPDCVATDDRGSIEGLETEELEEKLDGKIIGIGCGTARSVAPGRSRKNMISKTRAASS